VKKIVQRVSLLAFLIGAPTAVFAYPFKLESQSFQNYMNTRKWNDGSKVYFQNLNSCRQTEIYGDVVAYNGYICDSGYVTISNPKGTRVCDITEILYNFEKGRSSFKTSGCRYK
jgi:hypothetical protein